MHHIISLTRLLLLSAILAQYPIVMLSSGVPEGYITSDVEENGLGLARCLVMAGDGWSSLKALAVAPHDQRDAPSQNPASPWPLNAHQYKYISKERKLSIHICLRYDEVIIK